MRALTTVAVAKTNFEVKHKIINNDSDNNNEQR
jgi:hypothetical protein